MIKNRTTQLIFQSMFVAIGLIGVIASLGVFYINEGIRWDFYVHFTNLSNYLCVGIMIAELIQTAKKKTDSYVTVAPMLKFIGLLMITFTLIVFNVMLAPTREAYLNYRINSVTFHIIIPIMYIADWLLFYERKNVKWYAPFVSVLSPLIYVIFIFIRAWALHFNPDAPYIYPYFFLNLETQGVTGVLTWCGILFIAFIVLGFVFFLIDKILKTKPKCSEQREGDI